MARLRRINPRHVPWIEKAIMEHPRQTVKDYAVWTKMYALQEGLRQGVHASKIDELIYSESSLLAFANEGNIALPLRSSRGRDPAWVAKVTDRSVLVRTAKGAALAEIKGQLEARIENNPNPEAREMQAELFESMWGLATATPGQMLGRMFETEEVVQNIGHRQADLLESLDDFKNQITDMRDEQRVARQERQLLLRHFGLAAEAQPVRRGPGRPRRVGPAEDEETPEAPFRH